MFKDPNLWLLRAMPNNVSHFSIFKNNSVGGLGWPDLGDLSNSNLDELPKLFINNNYPAVDKASMGRRAGFFKRFINDIKVGDAIFTPDKDGQIHIGMVNSNYYYQPLTSDLAHLRNINWLKTINLHDLSDDAQKILSNRLTLISLNNNVSVTNELKLLLSTNDDPDIKIQSHLQKNISTQINNKKVTIKADSSISKEELSQIFRKIIEEY